MNNLCGCCEVLVPGLPRLAQNRPGLSKVEYRIGTFATFLRGMLDAAAGVEVPDSNIPPGTVHSLQKWTSRHEDDYGVNVLELWAYVADVLTFYQERAINEAFLLTAIHRESLLRLAGLLDYRPAPGLAATTHLAFTLERGKRLVVPVGLRVQSVPEQKEKPQKFETIEPLEASEALNRFPVLPAPQAHTPLVLNSPAGILAAGQSFAPPLAAGQRLAVFVPGTAGVEDKAIQSVTTTAGAARLAWTPRLQRAWTGGSVVRWMRKLRLFGSGGPDAWLRPTVRGGVITFASENIDYSIAGGATQLSLDAIYDTLQPGQRLLIAAPTFTRMIDVTSVVQHSPPPLGPLNSTVTRVEFGAAQSLPAIADSRTVVVYEVSGPDIQFAALEYLPSIAGNRVYVRTLNATGLTKRKTLILDDEQVSPAFGVITNVAPNTPNAEHVELTLDPALSRALDTATAFAYGNVTKATHGETVPAEILGNGDAGTPFQQFRLAKPPLTYVPKPGAPNGADSTLELRVNGILWQPVRSFLGRGPRDRVYTTARDEKEITTVRFGDGQTGATPETGRDNVVARYRQGLGAAGNVHARALRNLLDKPVGLKGTVNPLTAGGGAEPETLDALRTNAPNTVRTFGRIVSLLDFEDTARSFPGLAKARAVSEWSGEEQVVFLVVAGAGGAQLTSEQRGNLILDLNARRDPNRKLVLEDHHNVGVTVAVNVRVDSSRIPAEVQQAVRSALAAHFSFENSGFGQTIHLSDIYAAAQNVSGVVAADVDTLQFVDPTLRATRTDGAPQQLRLLFARNELPVVRDPDADILVNLMPN